MTFCKATVLASALLLSSCAVRSVTAQSRQYLLCDGTTTPHCNTIQATVASQAADQVITFGTLNLFPNTLMVGIGTTDLSLNNGFILSGTGVGMVTGPSNASVISMAAQLGGPAGIGADLSVGKTGSGILLPLRFWRNPNEIARFSSGRSDDGASSRPNENSLLIGLKESDVSLSTPGLISAGAVVMATSTANASILSLNAHLGGASGPGADVSSGATGSGTALPLRFWINPSELGRFSAAAPNAGAFLVGLQSSDVTVSGGGIINGNSYVVASASANAELGSFGMSPGNYVALSTGHTGSGVTRPLTFWFGASEKMRITNAGVFVEGALTADSLAATTPNSGAIGASGTPFTQLFASSNIDTRKLNLHDISDTTLLSGAWFYQASVNVGASGVTLTDPIGNVDWETRILIASVLDKRNISYLDLTPGVTSTTNLGGASYVWDKAYLNQIAMAAFVVGDAAFASTDVNFRASAGVGFDFAIGASDQQLQVSSDDFLFSSTVGITNYFPLEITHLGVTPHQDNLYTLGSAAHRWSDVRSANATFTNLTVSSCTGCGAGGGVTSQSVVTGSRAIGTIYHNAGATPILATVSVNVTGGGGAASVYTDSSATPTTLVAQLTNGNTSLDVWAVSFWVLPGNYYKVTQAAGTITVQDWTEWQ